MKMDFSAVVHKTRQLLAGVDQGLTSMASQVSEHEQLDLVEDIYGRVCTTVGKEPPVRFSSDPARTSVFLFGPDAVKSILLQESGYEILCSIGRDKDYLHHTMIEQRSSFWLVLFTSDAFPSSEPSSTIAPATWEGVIKHTRTTFPDAFGDLMNNINTLKQRNFETFEEEAGFQFLNSKKNRHSKDNSGLPPYFSYQYFCSLPKPRTAWQVRAFLFCELRLLKLFTGDGYTCNEGRGGQRVLEYLGPNVRLGDMDTAKCVVLRMNIEYEDVLAKCHS